MFSFLHRLLMCYRTIFLVVAIGAYTPIVWMDIWRHKRMLNRIACHSGVGLWERSRRLAGYWLRCEIWLFRRIPRMAGWDCLNEWQGLILKIERCLVLPSKPTPNQLRTDMARRLRSACIQRTALQVLGLDLSSVQAKNLSETHNIPNAILKLAEHGQASGLVHAASLRFSSKVFSRKSHRFDFKLLLRQVSDPFEALFQLQSSRNAVIETIRIPEHEQTEQKNVENWKRDATFRSALLLREISSFHREMKARVLKGYW